MPMDDLKDLRKKLIFFGGIVISLWHIYANTLGTMPELTTSALHYGLFAALLALILPGLSTRVAIGVGVLALSTVAYVILAEQALFDRGLRFSTWDWIFSLATIILVLELVRRTSGFFIPAVILVALSYVIWWGQYVPGVMQFPGLSIETMAFRSYFGSDGMFGPIARISSTFVFMFILFGAFLTRSGAGEFVVEIAKAVAGRFAGGPGFVAVIASGLTGTVMGSAVANTVSTGVITIPLMRKAGFPATFAAGVEAAASTGGQLMPPIMGAGAFVMASYTQIPYLQIVAVSVLPALLYFLSVGFFVRIRARRLDLQPSYEDSAPVWEILFKQGPSFIIPIAVLIALLVNGFTPTYAAGVAILAVIASSWLTPKRMGFKAIAEALSLGARNMANTAMLLIAIGLVVNVVATTGIGATFSLMINEWAGGNLFVAIILVAIASLVLGAGLPVTASYIVLATLTAPALYHMIAMNHLLDALMDGTLQEGARNLMIAVRPEWLLLFNEPMAPSVARAFMAEIPPELLPMVIDQGIEAGVLTGILLSAHMIIFWLSQDSNVTPPVCIVAYSAAAIAESPPLQTGLMAWKIAKGLYIMPFLFAFTPILSGDWMAAGQVFAFAIVAIYALAGALEGYLERALHPLAQVLVGFSGILMLWPANLLANFIGLGLFLVLFGINRGTKHA